MNLRARLVFWLPLALCTSRAAHAKPPASDPAPAVVLRIDARTIRGPWTLRVTNESDLPVRIVADGRLLALDVTPRGAHAPTRCELPADMRPDGDAERVLVMPPKRSYSETFEPRLYCFADKLAALSPGAIVVARLGFATGGKSRAPFELSPLEGASTDFAPRKTIDALPIALPDEPSGWTQPQDSAPAGASPSPEDVPRLSLRGEAAVDAEMPNNIEIPIALRNEGTHAAVVRFRPEVLSFDLVGPSGAEHCTWPMVPAAALREMFSRLAPNASESLNVTLASYCRGHGLDKEGLLIVTPHLDTRGASGTGVGLRTFDGELVAVKPTVVRLHRGTAAHHLEPPHLDTTDESAGQGPRKS